VVKTAGAWGDDLTTFIVPKVKKIRSLNLWISKGLLRPVVGKLYLLPTRFGHPCDLLQSVSQNKCQEYNRSNIKCLTEFSKVLSIMIVVYKNS
jgi:hypothetical protein